MRDFPLGLREVIPNQTVPENVAKETFNITTGKNILIKVTSFASS